MCKFIFKLKYTTLIIFEESFIFFGLNDTYINILHVNLLKDNIINIYSLI